MFTQREDHLQEGNMLIHSWYRLGRGTPHCPWVVWLVIQDRDGRRSWQETTESPGPPGLGTLKSQILSCSYTNPSETEVQRRILLDISIHYSVVEAWSCKGMEPSTPSLPHPGQGTEKGTPTLPSFSPSFPPAAAAQAWASCTHPTSPQWVSKVPRKDV